MIRSDGRRGLVEGGGAAVSARLRPAVEAYFDAVGRMGDARAKDASK
jgi:hypothetical protein